MRLERTGLERTRIETSVGRTIIELLYKQKSRFGRQMVKTGFPNLRSGNNGYSGELELDCSGSKFEAYHYDLRNWRKLWHNLRALDKSPKFWSGDF